MFLIKNVKIKGMWGNKNIMAKMSPDSNIYIGKNGSGKTTFINLIKAVLTVDIIKLQELDFEYIKIFLVSEDKKQKTIIVSRDNDLSEKVIYKISNSTSTTIPFVSREILYQNRTTRVRSIKSIILELQDTIKGFLNISMLSVSRELIADIDEEEELYRQTRYNRVGYIKSNPVDDTLSKLTSKLNSYQLQLQSKANNLSVDFQKGVLNLILYNKTMDTIDKTFFEKVDYDEFSRNVKHAFDLLGMKSSGNTKINGHVNAIKTSVSKLKDSKELKINDVLPLSLYKRTKEIIKMSSNLDENKIEIYSLIKTYEKVINDFFEDKSFSLNTSSDEPFDIILKRNKSALKICDLSSGEKQLLIIFTEVLLHEKERVVFLADEPELSLHISWQRKLLNAIKEINPNAQLIIATHSPEVASSQPNSLIQMSSVFYDE